MLAPLVIRSHLSYCSLAFPCDGRHFMCVLVIMLVPIVVLMCVSALVLCFNVQ